MTRWKHIGAGVLAIVAALAAPATAPPAAAKPAAAQVVLGGGNAKKLTRLPMGCRMGDNANAFLGGFRLWEGTRR